MVDAIYADPTNAANYVALARLQVSAGDYDEAIVNTQNALLKNPNNPLAHAVMGWALGFQEKYREAEIEIKKAESLNRKATAANLVPGESLLFNK